MKWSLVKKYLLFLWKVRLKVATSSFTSFITCLIASSSLSFSFAPPAFADAMGLFVSGVSEK